MRFKRDWNDFLFQNVPAGPVALVRIAFGLLVIFAALQLFADRAAFFSEHGLFPIAVSDAYNVNYTPGPLKIDILWYMHQDWQVNLFFVVYIIAAILMTVGLWTRPATFLVWLGLISIHNRVAINNTTGGDQIMVIFVIWLFFSRADAVFSVSRLLRVRAGREGVVAPTMAIWPQRMMQLQVSIVYLSTFLNKAGGGLWQNGTAAYYPYMVEEFHRFPIPWMMDGLPEHMWFINLSTYGTLTIEFLLGTLVWVPRMRLYVITLGVMLHLGIEYAMNIPLFAFLMIASYISFLTQKDLEKLAKWLDKRFHIRIPNAVELVDLWDKREAASGKKVLVGK